MGEGAGQCGTENCHCEKRIAVSYTHERDVAVEAVAEAAELCMAVREEMVAGDSLEKADKSPVTVADFGSQALVCRRLREGFPRDPIVAEEDAEDLRKSDQARMLDQIGGYVRRFRREATSETLCDWIDLGNGSVSKRYWTLDPIDGTKGFLRNDQYAVALALVEGGEVKVGALACPALPLDLARTGGERGVLFVAVRGEGTVMVPIGGGTPSPVRVAEEPTLQNWRFVESVESAHGDHDLQQTIARAVGIREASLRMDSQAKYAAVARGDAVLYLRLPSPKYPDYREKIWDHAAGALVVEEAGGCVTDRYGNPLDFASGDRMEANRGVVVSSGAIHSDVIAALDQDGGTQGGTGTN